jgi:GTP-binding protein HflX
VKRRAKRRERDNLPMVALVGYTNAGKSTMLNKLCGTEEVAR